MVTSQARRAGGAAIASVLLLGLLVATPTLLPAQEAGAGASIGGDDAIDKLVGLDESDPMAVQVIDRYLDSIGGSETLAAIANRVERFNNKKLTPTGETVMKMSRYLARPVMIREEWELPGMGITKDNEPLRFVQIYDGEQAWVKAMGYVSSLTGKTLTVFVWDKHIDDFFTGWQDNGWTAKYVGPAEVAGRAVEVIELLSFAGNQKVRYTFSSDDGLLVSKSWSEGTPPNLIQKEVTFDEYLKIRFKDNPERWVRHATTHRIFENGELALEKVYTEIILNGGLAGDTFSRPDGPEYDPAEIQKRNAEAGAAAGAAAEKPKDEKKPVWEKPKPKPKPADPPKKETPPGG